MTISRSGQRLAPSAEPAPGVSLDSIRLSVGQAARLVFYLTLCVTPFSFGAEMIRTLGRWSWFGAVPGFLLGSAALASVAILRERMPDASVLQWAPTLLGRLGGWIYLLLLFALFGSGAGANLSVFVDMLHTTLSPGFSGWVPALVMSAMASYVAFFGPEVIARSGTALLFGVLPGLAFVFVLTWLNSQPGRLWPFWTVPWQQMVHHAAAAAGLGSARGFLPLLVLAPMVKGRRFFGHTFAAQAAGSALILLAFAIPVAVLGPTLAGLFRFPLLDAAGTLGWLWLPIQRLGHLAALIWEMVAFVVAATYIWLGAALGGWLFARGRWRPLVPVLGCVTLIMAGPLFSSQMQGEALTVWSWGVICVGILVPIGLAGLALLRRPAS